MARQKRGSPAAFSAFAGPENDRKRSIIIKETVTWTPKRWKAAANSLPRTELSLRILPGIRLQRFELNNLDFMDSYSSSYSSHPDNPAGGAFFDAYEPRPDLSFGPRDKIISATVVPDSPEVSRPEVVSKPRVSRLPFLLFIATCLSTLFVAGWQYSLAIMFILGCHEMGHYLQARRYRIKASLPYFIPMPISPIGTMGAVIAMQSRMGDRKSLFDIGISGPIAGLVPTLICCAVGIYLSGTAPIAGIRGPTLGAPFIFDWMVQWIHDPIPVGHTLALHPLAFAGWVGLLITALNLMPIGQLDGGHVLYGLVREKAHIVAKILLFGALAAMILFSYWGWMLMIFLLMMIGPEHPPTSDDSVQLGPVRTVLGWLMLAFIPIGFTPIPFNL